MAKTTKQPTDWILAALAAVAAEGVERVSVERLAKSLKVTKGSFYWHFTDRGALLVAAAEMWEQLGTTEVIDELQELPSPVERLRKLLEVSLGDHEMGPIDAALCAKTNDATIGQIVARVTARRIEFLESIFADLDFASNTAAQRARLTYSMYLGHFTTSQAIDMAPTSSTVTSDYLDEVVDVLTAGAGTASTEN